jgi:cytoskeletal protein CcmA (bactofilin family)
VARAAGGRFQRDVPHAVRERASEPCGKEAIEMIHRMMNGLRRRGTQGASVVILALSFLVLLGFAGLTIDVGHWYHVRSRLQSVGDAAALAGAVWLPDMTKAKNEALRYLALNSITLGAPPAGEVVFCDSTAGPPAQFEVQLLRVAGPYFTSVAGIGTVNVAVRSRAQPATRGQTGVDPSANAFNFSVYGGQEFVPPAFQQPQETKFAGADLRITGNVHVNGDFRIGGANNQVEGTATAGHNVTVQGGQGNSISGTVTNNGTKIPTPAADTTKAKADAAADGHYYKYINPGVFETCNAAGVCTAATPPPGATFSGDKIHFSGGTNVSGKYYVEGGGLQFSGAGMNGTASFVAEGEIHVSGAAASFAGGSAFGFTSLSSSGTAIKFDAQGSTVNGTFFAPNGTIQIATSNVTVNGALVAASVDGGTGSAIAINFASTGNNQIAVKAQTEMFVRLVD